MNDDTLIEPGAHRPNIKGDEKAWLMSIAISAKRLADAAERIADALETANTPHLSGKLSGMLVPPEQVYGGAE